MTGKIIRGVGRLAGNVAERSVHRSAGQMMHGATGAVVQRGLPLVLPRAGRRIGAAGMLAVAFGGVLLSRYLARRAERRANAAADVGPESAHRAEVVLGGPAQPEQR